MREAARYISIFATLARNSLVREMSFRFNFLAETVATVMWMSLSLFLYILIFQHTPSIGPDTGWTKYPYFVFLGTVMLSGGALRMLTGLNLEEFSNQVRKGDLDFVLLKPIDTQFLISLRRIDWSELADVLFGVILVGYALWRMEYVPGWLECLLYPIYVICGMAIMYSFMLALSTTSVWLIRNQSLSEFWFYLTTFSRHPLEIYRGPLGDPLRIAFTYIFPILVVINVPARLLARPMRPDEWQLAVFALVAAVVCLLLSRKLFRFALRSYRSASS